jgi:8-oxo-dGTP diphosphatase
MLQIPKFKIATERTICFLLRDTQILLGTKKRGLGQLNYNGFGGKLEPGETAKEAAIRELREEAGVLVKKRNLEKRATIDFNFPYKPEWNQRVHVYFVDAWKGEPCETEEMRPEWFPRDKIPYEKMWDSDKHWLPMLLEGKKIKAEFIWKQDNKTVDAYKIKEI